MNSDLIQLLTLKHANLQKMKELLSIKDDEQLRRAKEMHDFLIYKLNKLGYSKNEFIKHNNVKEYDPYSNYVKFDSSLSKENFDPCSLKNEILEEYQKSLSVNEMTN